jgi:hypothetical protein
VAKMLKSTPDSLLKLIIILSSDSSDIAKKFSFSIFTGLSFVGRISTSHLLVYCADRASANSSQLGL